MGTFKANLIAWLASAENGIHDLYAGIIHSQEDDTQKLCVQKSDGSDFCLTGDQLAANTPKARLRGRVRQRPHPHWWPSWGRPKQYHDPGHPTTSPKVEWQQPRNRKCRRPVRRPRRHHHRPNSRPQPRHPHLRRRQAVDAVQIDTAQPGTHSIDNAASSTPPAANDNQATTTGTTDASSTTQ